MNDFTNQLLTYAKTLQPPAVPIDAPPCPDCAYWRPQVITQKDGRTRQVRLCVAEFMHFDFSCYEPDQTKGKVRGTLASSPPLPPE